MLDDQIDRAIDRAAHEMTSGEPAPGFRARVTARLDADGSPPRAGAMWLSLAAVAAIVVIAIVGARYQGGLKPETMTASRGGPERAAPQTGPQTAAPQTGPQTAAPQTGPQTAAPQTGAPHTAAPSTVAPQPVAAPYAAANAGRGALAGGRSRRVSIPPSAIDALTPPLEMPTIAVDDLAPEPALDIQPLDTIAPIAVAPLGEGDRP
jgi:hypothetical protein